MYILFGMQWQFVATHPDLLIAVPIFASFAYREENNIRGALAAKK